MSTPPTLMGLLAAPFLFFLLVTPILYVARDAFTYQGDEALAAGVSEGKLTMEFVREVLFGKLASRIFWLPLWHTLFTSVASTLLAMAFGGMLAWLLTRTDIPGKRLLTSLALIPYIAPPWPLALAWIAAFQTDAVPGGRPGIVQWLFGVRVPFSICYGPLPIIVAEAIHLYAYAFLGISAALQRVDAALEEAADVLGVARRRTLLRITFPLALPAILSAVILTFGKVAGTFGTPYFVGNPAGYYTLATWLYALVQNGQNGRASIITLTLVLLSAGTLELNRRALGQARRFGTVSGKGFRAHEHRLRGFRIPVAAATAAVVIVTVAAPIGILLVQSLSSVQGSYGLGNLTLQFWTGTSNKAFAAGEPGILRNADMWRAAWSSVKLAIVASAICVIVGLPLAFCIHEGKQSWLSRAVELMTFVPYMTPSIAFGAVYLLMFARPVGPIPALYGTFTLLVLVSVAKHIPYAVRNETAALSQVGGELVDAARTLGIGTGLLLRRILIPLVRPTMVAAFIMMMISTMKELSLVILLVSPNTQLLTTFVYRYQELGQRGFSAAMVVFFIALVLVLSVVVRRLQGEDMTRRPAAVDD